jgi:hypothetical protein
MVVMGLVCHDAIHTHDAGVLQGTQLNRLIEHLVWLLICVVQSASTRRASTISRGRPVVDHTTAAVCQM